MRVTVLCHFRASVVNDLVVKLRLNFQKWWATAPKGRAAMPVVVWCCQASFRNTLIKQIAYRLSLGETIGDRRRTANRHWTARQLWGSSCLVRQKISIRLFTALQQRICPVPKSLRLQSC